MYGLMWLDASPKKTLENKVKEGKEYFEKKYGEGLLEYCYLSYGFETENNKEAEIEGLKVRANRSILNNHYYFVVKSEFEETKLNPIRKGEN